MERLAPYIERIIIVAPEPESEWSELKKWPNVDYHQVSWEDNFVEYRNTAISYIPDNEWIAYSDPDEVYCEELAKNLLKIVETCERAGYNHLFINSHDITKDSDGETRTSISSFYKGLIFKKLPGSHYEGVGQTKNLHEALILPNEKQHTLPKQYYYEHFKEYWEIWERAARNVFISGGGNNRGKENPSWESLREICNSLGLRNWDLARTYFRKGNADPRLRQWLKENNVDGTDYEHEEMEFGRWYFEYLHKDENDGWTAVTELPYGSKAEVMRFVENAYLEVLGRHADQEGKENYARLIMNGMPRDKFVAILRTSPERAQRFGHA